MSKGPRTNADPATRPSILLLGVVVVLAGLGMVYIAFTSSNGPPGQPHFLLRAQLANLGNLPARGADVRIAGRRVGQTIDSRLKNGRPEIELQLDSDVGGLPADTRLRVRPRGLLGDQYVELDPGRSSRKLEDGDTIPARQTSVSTQVPDVLDTFDPRRRRALREVLRGLGTGFAGRGRGLNGFLRVTPGALNELSAVTGAILRRRGAMARFVDSAELMMAAFDPVREDLAKGFGDAADALRPFADERRHVGELLDVAPSSLAGLRDGLRRTDQLLIHTSRFARAATSFSASAPAALDAATRLLTKGRAPMHDARVVLSQTRAAIPPTLAATGAIGPVLPRQRATLEDARPPTRTLGGAYSCDLRRFAANWRSYTGFTAGGRPGPLGPLTSLRVLDGETFRRTDAPVKGALNAYPRPCTDGRAP